MDDLVKMTPDTGEEQWEDVDEEVADGDTTYIWNSGKTTYRQGYLALPAHSGVGTINQVTVYMRCAGEVTPSQASLKIGVYTYSTAYWSSELTITNSYTNYPQIWPTNPDTGSAWTWTEIDELEVGITLRGVSPDLFKRTKCTQVRVEVDYTPTATPKTSSDSGSGSENVPLQTAALSGSESGQGQEAISSQLVAISAGDAATSLETGSLLKELTAAELGQGSDSFVSKIESPTKGGGMKLWI